MVQNLKKLAAALRKFNLNSKIIDQLIIYAAHQFEIDDEVIITNGRYASMRGLITNIDWNTGMVSIAIKMFGRNVPVQVSINDIEPTSNKRTQMDTVFLQPTYDINSFKNVAKKDPYVFIKSVIPIFDQLSDDKIKLIEEILWQECSTSRVYNSKFNIRNWLDSIGKFLSEYPEYISPSLFQGGSFVFIIEKIVIEGLINLSSSFLKSFSEDFLLQEWNNLNNNSVIPAKTIARTLLSNPQLEFVQPLKNIFPNFFNLIGHLMAIEEPEFYIKNNLDELYQDQINLSDVEEQLFKVDKRSFLEQNLSKKYPELAKKAVHSLIFNESTNSYNLTYFFESGLYQNYPIWVNDAVNKLINKYPTAIKTMERSFLETEFGKNLIDKAATYLLDHNRLNDFFAGNFHFQKDEVNEYGLMGHKPNDIGLQAAKILLEQGTKESLNMFRNFELTHYYPQLYNLLEEKLALIPEETDEERQARWEQEDIEREKSWSKQQQPMLKEKSEQEKLEEDPDFQEHFERGQ